MKVWTTATIAALALCGLTAFAQGWRKEPVNLEQLTEVIDKLAAANDRIDDLENRLDLADIEIQALKRRSR
jgi:hypothetical protein